MKGPLISFIMPVYNVTCKWVHEAVESVLAADVDLELVIVDDGSSDPATLAALEHHKLMSDRVQVIRQSNAGVAAARNHGVSVASGRWISFVDPDDRLDSHSRALSLPGVTNSADLILAGAVGLSVDGARTLERYSLEHLSGTPTPEDLLVDLATIYKHGRKSSSFLLGVPWARFVTRDFLQRHDLTFNESIVKRSDAEWMIRVLNARPRVLAVNDTLVKYRLDVQNSISRRYRPEIGAGYVELARTIDIARGVPDEVKQLYRVELLKDAVNNVFANPAAPPDARSRRAYSNYRKQFDLSLPLFRKGWLRGVGVPRTLLYLAISRGWYVPVLALRAVKTARTK